ncbi:MAG: deoxyribonuclease [Archaeoglobaceae archaeon]|nr:deoxyribonuclease [Archaeoglobaceae archaeon]MDK2876850.1 deoxyribonuclease [Archaeoglobaceae archaeon]
MNLEELKQLQLKIAQEVDLSDRYRISEIKYLIGVDQTFLGDKIISCAVKFEFPELKEVERSFSIDEVAFPYIPGFLMFREGEPAIRAVEKLISDRTVIIVDGSGIAHPRKCGLATYIAIKTNTPSIGVTKKRLFGEVVGEGEVRAIKDGEKVIGYTLKGCKNCKEIFISPGNFISPETALEVIKSCMRGKLPLPIQVAHNFGQELKKKLQATRR